MTFQELYLVAILSHFLLFFPPFLRLLGFKETCEIRKMRKGLWNRLSNISGGSTYLSTLPRETFLFPPRTCRRTGFEQVGSSSGSVRLVTCNFVIEACFNSKLELNLSTILVSVN